MKWTRGHNPDADSALFASRRAPCGFKSMIEPSKHRAGIVEEGTPSVGQLDTARLSAKELHIEFAFDRLDALTEWRLLHAKPLCSPRDVPFLGNSDEILQVPEFHGIFHEIWISSPAYYGSTFYGMLLDDSIFRREGHYADWPARVFASRGERCRADGRLPHRPRAAISGPSDHHGGALPGRRSGGCDCAHRRRTHEGEPRSTASRRERVGGRRHPRRCPCRTRRAGWLYLEHRTTELARVQRRRL